MAECLPSKQNAAGSNPVFRLLKKIKTAAWPSGKAEACKAFIPGSIPGAAFFLKGTQVKS